MTKTPQPDLYKKVSSSMKRYWSALTPSQRSAEMSRRRKLGYARKLLTKDK